MKASQRCTNLSKALGRLFSWVNDPFKFKARQQLHTLRPYPQGIMLLIASAVLDVFAMRLGMITSTGVSVIWPSAGLWFAACLIYGWRSFPWLVIGAFLADFINLSILDTSSPPAFAIQSIGARLSSFLAAALACRFMLKRLPNNTLNQSLHTIYGATRLLFALAFIFPFISTIIALIAWHLAHLIDNRYQCMQMGDAAAYWISNAYGSILISWLILCYFNHNKYNSNHHHRPHTSRPHQDLTQRFIYFWNIYRYAIAATAVGICLLAWPLPPSINKVALGILVFLPLSTWASFQIQHIGCATVCLIASAMVLIDLASTDSDTHNVSIQTVLHTAGADQLTQMTLTIASILLCSTISEQGQQIHSLGQQRHAVIRQRARLQEMNKKSQQQEHKERQALAHTLREQALPELQAAQQTLQKYAATPAIDETLRHIHSAMDDIHQTASLLSPQLVTMDTLADQLQAIQLIAQQDCGIPVNCQIHDDLPQASEQALTIGLRGVRECLMNVAKHAQATQAGMIVSSSHQAILLTVWDNGQGFDASTLSTTHTTLYNGQSVLKSGFGLISLAEQLRQIGGRLTMTSMPAPRGTQVQILLPVHT